MLYFSLKVILGSGVYKVVFEVILSMKPARVYSSVGLKYLERMMQ